MATARKQSRAGHFTLVTILATSRFGNRCEKGATKHEPKGRYLRSFLSSHGMPVRTLITLGSIDIDTVFFSFPSSDSLCRHLTRQRRRMTSLHACVRLRTDSGTLARRSRQCLLWITSRDGHRLRNPLVNQKRTTNQASPCFFSWPSLASYCCSCILLYVGRENGNG